MIHDFTLVCALDSGMESQEDVLRQLAGTATAPMPRSAGGGQVMSAWPSAGKRATAMLRSTGTQETDAESELTARWARKELAEREQLRELALADPGAALDKFAPKVAKVRDGAAERGQARA